MTASVTEILHLPPDPGEDVDFRILIDPLEDEGSLVFELTDCGQTGYAVFSPDEIDKIVDALIQHNGVVAVNG